MTERHSTHERGFRPQLHYIVMILTWLLVIGSVLLYFMFVKFNVWRPPVAWWLLTSGMVIFATLVAGFLVVARLWRRTHRTWAIAIFMFTVIPLVWFGCFSWKLVSVANNRGDLQVTLPTRAFGIWVGNWFELEARWRYPRITEGENVTLFDNGDTPNVDQLVAKMDDHINSMAAVLGRPAPNTKTVWVRGKLFDQSARAVGAWAICDTSTDTDDLRSLDKHEVAHTAITMLGDAEIDMPMLFAEGWASSQSANRPRAVISLLNDRRSGQALTLMDLVSEEYYGRSVGPAYSHGAPLVWYLLERFGGPKFLELYTNVRRPTFEQDVQRILGTTWQQLDSDFWNWLDSQEESALKSQPADNIDPPLIITRPQDEPLWDQIVEASRKSAKEFQLPETAALQLRNEGPVSYRTRLVIEKDAAWTTMKFDDEQAREFTVCQSGKYEFIVRQEDGRLKNETSKYADVPASSRIAGLKDFWFRRQKLANFLLLDVLDTEFRMIGVTTTIHSIEPGATPDEPWKISYSARFRDLPDNDEDVRLWLDPNHFFDVIRARITYKQPESVRDIRHEFGELVGMRTVTGWTIDGEDGNKSQITVREMTPDEMAHTKERVEVAVKAAGPSTAEKVDWNLLLFNPLTLAIAWPVLAVVILGIDIVGERVKIRVPRPSDSREPGENHE